MKEIREEEEERKDAKPEPKGKKVEQKTKPPVPPKIEPKKENKEENKKKGEDDKQTQTKHVRQISVSEAEAHFRTNDSEVKDTKPTKHEESFESSEEEFVPVVKRRIVKPQGFAFPDEGFAAKTFKTQGEIINAKPVKGKKKRRAARRISVENLPNRVHQAFGLTVQKTGQKQPPGQTTKTTGKETTSQESKEQQTKEKTLPALRGAPMSIKDISKKPAGDSGNTTAEQTPRGRASTREGQGRTVDATDSSVSPAPTGRRAESRSPAARRSSQGQGQDQIDRRTSDTDKRQQMQLMTRLMSLSEQPETESSPRASTASKRSTKSRQSKGQISLTGFKSYKPDILIDDLEQLGNSEGSTPDPLVTGREGSVLPGRPPTQHEYVRPSREGSGLPASRGLSRSNSDRKPPLPHTDSSRTGGTTHSNLSPDSEEQRFVRFKEGVLKQLGELGQDDMNAILYPRKQRYPEGPRRGEPAYKSMNALQRIHRRKFRQVHPDMSNELPPIRGAYGKMIDDYDDVDDPRMKGLLEELYKDKKFLDKSIRQPEEDDFVMQRSQEGRNYLLNRARFWSTQQPLVRPGTQAGGTRASTAVPSSRGSPITRDIRAKSDERPRHYFTK